MLEVRGAIHVLRTVRTFTVGLWIALLLCVDPGRAATTPAEATPAATGNWVADTLGILGEADRAALNRLGDAVHATDPHAALFVVTIVSTHGVNHRRYAAEQLNQYGRYDPLTRGVLILLARADRKAEIVLGDSLHQQYGAVLSDRVMRNTLVPAMQRDDPRGALLSAAHACAEMYFDLRLGPDGQVTRIAPTEMSPVSEVPPGSAPSTHSGGARPSGSPVAMPIAPATFDLERPTSAESTPTTATAPASVAPPTSHAPVSAPRHRAVDPSDGLGTVLMMAFGVVVVVGGGIFVLIKASGPRKCPTCRQPMQELPPAAEAPHLTPSERTEERVGSVNYRIWHCAPCGKFEKTRHGQWFSGFSGCPQCRAETRREIKRTVRAATTYSTGLAEITEHCEHCGYHHVSMRTLPQLPEPRRSNSSSGFGGGSRGGSSSGRSSSGGGSSGSW